MRRNFSGTLLAFLLLAVVAMKQVALGFCLCDTSYFLDSCNCHEEAAPAGCAEDCCPDHRDEDEELPSPCDDCETTVSLDSGEYLWSAPGDLHPSFEVSDLPDHTSAEVRILPTGLPLRGATSPRGSPLGHCALFLRHQSLRL